MGNAATKILGYGKTGSGKTEQIRSLIRAFGPENVGILSAEAGLSTIASAINPDMVRDVTDMDSLRAGWAWINEKFNRPDAWCVMDGASRIMQYVADAEFKGAYDMQREFLGGTKPKDMKVALREYVRYLTEGEKIDGRAIWVTIGRQARLTIKKFLELHCNQFWNAFEEQTFINQFEKGFPWKPDAPGSTSQALVEAFDWVFRFMRIDGGECTAHTDPTSRIYTAKRRLDIATGLTIPDEITDFNLATFYTTLKAAQPTKEEVTV